MKPIFLFFVSIILLTSCKTEELSKSILLLKVDYLTHSFEGGKEIILQPSNYQSDSLPILIDYQSPGDFGGIKLFYQPTGEMFFEGTIVWMGCGQISFPQNLIDSTGFELNVSPQNMPDTSRFQNVFGAPNYPIDYSSIWNSVKYLKVVKTYTDQGRKVGLFLYTPSVGVGNPADWDWFLIFLN